MSPLLQTLMIKYHTPQKPSKNYFYFNGICELFLVVIVSRILVYIYNIIKHLIFYYASLYGSNPINKVYYRYFKFSISIIPYNTTKNIVAL